MNRGVIVSLVVAAALILPFGTVFAAGSPVTPSVSGTTSPGSYFYAMTCTDSPSHDWACAEEYLAFATPTPHGTPTGGYFRCSISTFLHPLRALQVSFGNEFLAGRYSTGSAAGTGGASSAGSSQAAVFNFLSGSSQYNASYNPVVAGRWTSGSANGLLLINNATGRVTGGSIKINLSGAIDDFHGPLTQGSMSCDINPVGAAANTAHVFESVPNA